MPFEGLSSRAVPYSTKCLRKVRLIEMKSDRKISVLVNRELLAKAQKAARAGINETVRKGLEVLVENEAYDQLLKMRGKVKFSVDLNELRQDR